MATVFVTGFPGFLGSALVKRLLKRFEPDVSITCLVQEKYLPLAEQRVSELAQDLPRARERVRILRGDITVPDLGLAAELEGLQADTVEIYHLAAVYDLGVGRELAMRVNLDGTRHMLAFAQACENLTRFQYASTCYVSGRYPGTFRESDLSVSQQFNNYYDETKYLAELEAQKAMHAGLPTTIYRPSIVVGDSQTGETQKYDGSYYIINLLLAQPRVAVLPLFGDPTKYTFNNVPRDFVVDAMDYLSARPISLNKVYHLSDPDEPTLQRLIDVFGDATGRQVVGVRVPKNTLKGMLHLHVPGLPRGLEIEPESVEYFVHPTRYATDNTLRDLAGSGIACPPIEAYARNLVAYVKANPDVSSAAMI